jgi:hypothetical protein
MGKNPIIEGTGHDDGVCNLQLKTWAQFIYEISPLIYVFFPIPIMGKSTIENPHIFYSHFLKFFP